MKQIELGTVTLFLSEETAAAYEREMAEAAAEAAAWEALRRMDPRDPLYSDVYKDVHGVRP